LLLSPRFKEHRRRLRAEVEHWQPTKSPVPPGYIVGERSPSEEAAFRRKISAYVVNRTVDFCWLYYRAFLPGGTAAVRRGRAEIIATARNAASLAGKLSAAMRQLWHSGNPAVQRILVAPADQYPKRDELPVALGDPGFVAALEEMRLRVELIATALPPDRGGRRRSVLFEELAMQLATIYNGITYEPALISARAGAPDGRFFRFVKAVIVWLKAATVESPDINFDLPQNDDALRMALHRLERANTTPAAK
jgi:hypothetical protein